jgi:hypothetical protein
VVRAVLDLRAEDFEPVRGNRAEPALRRRMGLWARAVLGRLRKQGFEGAARAKDRPGAKLVIFVLKGGFGLDGRGGLVLRIDRHGVEVGAEIPARGARKARACLADPTRALELGAALEALPEPFAIGLGADEVPLGAASAKVDEVRSLFARSDREERSLWIRWQVPRDLVIARSARLGGELEDAIVILAGISLLLAGEGERRARPVRRPRANGRGRGGGVLPDDDRDGREARARGGRSLADGEGDRRERDADLETEREPGTPSARPPRSLDAGALLRSGRRRTQAQRPAPGRSIERGSKVRVVDGPFAGKVGVVQELDGRGGARVMLGLLAVRVDLNNLAPSTGGHQRLRLSTSHRKPMPARS